MTSAERPSSNPASRRWMIIETGLAVVGFGLYGTGLVAGALAAGPFWIATPDPQTFLNATRATLLLGIFASTVCPTVVAVWSSRRIEVVATTALVAGALAARTTSGLTLVVAFEFAVFCAFGNLVRNSDEAAWRKGFAAVGGVLIAVGCMMRFGDPPSAGLIGAHFWAHALRCGTTFVVVAVLPESRRLRPPPPRGGHR